MNTQALRSLFDRKRNPSAFFLTVSLLVSILVLLLPYSGLLLYPVRLLVTFFHEASHAIATTVTFGEVVSLEVNWDTSGMVTRKGGFGPLISSAGYLGTTALGAALVMLSRDPNRIRMLLSGLGLGTLVTAMLWGGKMSSIPTIALLAIAGALFYFSRTQAWEAQKNPLRIGAVVSVLAALGYIVYSGALLTLLVGVGCGAVLIWIGRKAPQQWAHLVLAFVAVQTCFNALYDIRILAGLSIQSPGTHTDAQNMAESLFSPAIFWAILWALISLAVVGFAIWRFYTAPVLATAGGGGDPVDDVKASVGGAKKRASRAVKKAARDAAKAAVVDAAKDAISGEERPRRRKKKKKATATTARPAGGRTRKKKKKPPEQDGKGLDLDLLERAFTSRRRTR